jgi:hypothetical protein
MLSRTHEKMFLAHVGPVALKATAEQSRRGKATRSRIPNKGRRRSPATRIEPTAH